MAGKPSANKIGWQWYMSKPKRVINDAAAAKRGRASKGK